MPSAKFYVSSFSSLNIDPLDRSEIRLASEGCLSRRSSKWEAVLSPAYPGLEGVLLDGPGCFQTFSGTPPAFHLTPSVCTACVVTFAARRVPWVTSPHSLENELYATVNSALLVLS